MNEPFDPDANGAPDVPWPTSGRYMPVPRTSMLPETELTPPAAGQVLKRVVQGACDGVEGLRGAVRRHPLMALAVAWALGAAVSRSTRRAKARAAV